MIWETGNVKLNGLTLGEDASILVIVLLLIFGALAVAFICYYVARLIISIIARLFKLNKGKHSAINSLYQFHVIQRFSYLIPALLLYMFNQVFDINIGGLKLYIAAIIRAVAAVYVIFGIALLLSATLNFIQDRYSHLPIARLKPIKSYLQVIKIILYVIAAFLAIATLAGRSPIYFISSLGALTAIILLIFKDSILGFVASIQLAAYDMVHIGDSIEMPTFGADGEVIDISLNTVEVQNADKSIVTIPSYALLTSGMKNWRGMKEAGGRRIKRSINIDLTSIKNCNQQLLNRLRKIPILKNAVPEAPLQINSSMQIEMSNIRHFTNLGLFCHYLELYMRAHPGLRKDMKMLVRQLEATPTGLPLQLYVFTNDTHQDRYEVIQASIMEHIYAMLPVFDLRLFQYPSDHIADKKPIKSYKQAKSDEIS